MWDQKIRREIHDCALFIPVISANTSSRHEGYFRLEWDLADQRTHMMGRNRVFIVPVCLDATPEAGADVPESFQRVQWTRLPAGETPPAFVERVRRLLSPELSITTPPPASPVSGAVAVIGGAVRTSWWSRKPVLLASIAIVVLAALAYFVANKFWHGASSQPVTSAQPATSSASPVPTAFAPPPHSIAVLPFVNLSGDNGQEYFSDGLTEELLNSLAEIEGLQVAARTSSFSFKEHPDIVTVAHKLNVASVLEGSVRRSAKTVRVTAQLINAVTGFHLWSKTYDRDLGDVLRLQTEIATAVADALKITLLGDVSTKIELGGTHNPAALDAYLRASKVSSATHGQKGLQSVIDSYGEAIRLDPNYALAFAGRSSVFSTYAEEFATGAAIREAFEKAQADARQAIALAPELAEGHLALAKFSLATLHFEQANQAFERALALAPGNAAVLDNYGRFAIFLLRTDAGIASARHAVTLDPLNPAIRRHLGYALIAARRYPEAIAAHQGALALDPDSTTDHAFLGIAYYILGDLKSAQASCEVKSNENQWLSLCLAMTYDKLGRHADAQAELTKIQAAFGDASAYQCAEIYAQWGNRPKAMEWLDTAMRLRDSGLQQIKADPLMDPLRKEPRFQAIERELKFPN